MSKPQPLSRTQYSTRPSSSGAELRATSAEPAPRVNFMAVAISQSPNSNAYTDDGGRTLKRIPGQSNFPYGNCAIAVSNKNNIMLIGTNNDYCHYTKNGGTTWNRIQLNPGVDLKDQCMANYVYRKVVTSDKTRPGVFAYVGRQQESGADVNTGLWVTTDGGDTWTKKRTLVGDTLPNMDKRQF